MEISALAKSFNEAILNLVQCLSAATAAAHIHQKCIEYIFFEIINPIRLGLLSNTLKLKFHREWKPIRNFMIYIFSASAKTTHIESSSAIFIETGAVLVFSGLF